MHDASFFPCRKNQEKYIYMKDIPQSELSLGFHLYSIFLQSSSREWREGACRPCFLHPFFFFIYYCLGQIFLYSFLYSFFEDVGVSKLLIFLKDKVFCCFTYFLCDFLKLRNSFSFFYHQQQVDVSVLVFLYVILFHSRGRRFLRYLSCFSFFHVSQSVGVSLFLYFFFFKRIYCLQFPFKGQTFLFVYIYILSGLRN